LCRNEAIENGFARTGRDKGRTAEVIGSGADLAPGFASPTGYNLATPDRVQMCEPAPLPYESRRFAQRAPPPGSFVSRGQADLETRPIRPGLWANLNLRFYVGPAWLWRQLQAASPTA
jgi:hypothetical protein